MTAPNDVILDRIPEGVDPRKNIGMSVKIAVLLRMLGLRLDDVQWDHRPPLWSRKWNATTQDTVPPASDPEFIVALSVKAHDTVTNGRGGERRITSAGSDTHARAQADRLNEKTAEFRRTVLAKASGEPKPEQRSTFGKRAFPIGRKLQSRNTFQERRR